MIKAVAPGLPPGPARAQPATDRADFPGGWDGALPGTGPTIPSGVAAEASALRSGSASRGTAGGRSTTAPPSVPALARASTPPALPPSAVGDASPNTRPSRFQAGDNISAPPSR